MNRYTIDELYQLKNKYPNIIKDVRLSDNLKNAVIDRYEEEKNEIKKQLGENWQEKYIVNNKLETPEDFQLWLEFLTVMNEIKKSRADWCMKNKEFIVEEKIKQDPTIIFTPEAEVLLEDHSYVKDFPNILNADQMAIMSDKMKAMADKMKAENLNRNTAYDWTKRETDNVNTIVIYPFSTEEKQEEKEKHDNKKEEEEEENLKLSRKIEHMVDEYRSLIDQIFEEKQKKLMELVDLTNDNNMTTSSFSKRIVDIFDRLRNLENDTQNIYDILEFYGTKLNKLEDKTNKEDKRIVFDKSPLEEEEELRNLAFMQILSKDIQSDKQKKQNLEEELQNVEKKLKEEREELESIKQQNLKFTEETEKIKGETEKIKGETEKIKEEAEKMKKALEQLRLEKQKSIEEAKEAKNQAEMAKKQTGKIKIKVEDETKDETKPKQNLFFVPPVLTDDELVENIKNKMKNYETAIESLEVKKRASKGKNKKIIEGNITEQKEELNKLKEELTIIELRITEKKRKEEEEKEAIKKQKEEEEKARKKQEEEEKAAQDVNKIKEELHSGNNLMGLEEEEVLEDKPKEEETKEEEEDLGFMDVEEEDKPKEEDIPKKEEDNSQLMVLEEEELPDI